MEKRLKVSDGTDAHTALPRSYVYAFVITLIFAALTNLVMRSRLEKVDMAESLKSVE